MLISYPEGFSLGWRGATARLLDLAEGLASLGWNVTMLSSRSVGQHDQSAQEQCFPGRVIRTPFTGAYPRWIDTSPKLRRLYRGTWKIFGERHYYERLALGWAERTEEWFPRNWNLPSPDVVWAICTSNLNGIVAGRKLAKVFDCPLVLEFQDPPSSKGNRLHTALLAVFRQVLRNSNGVVTTSCSYAQHLVDTHQISSAAVLPLHLSFSQMSSERVLRKQEEPLIFLHAGSLRTDCGRNARSLVAAFAQLLRTRPECQGQIRLRLLGGGDGAQQARRLAEASGIGTSVEVVPEVPLEKAEEAMDLADVLVVIKYADPLFDMQIPGKLFQYLAKVKPILGIMPPATEAAQILAASGLGLVSSNADVEGIAGNLRRIWEARNNFETLIEPDLDYIAQFSRERMANRCHEFLLRVVDQGAQRRVADGSGHVIAIRDIAS